jgi:hypothetical protein
MPHSHGNKLMTVEVLRKDGTAWPVKSVKHVVEGENFVKLYVGEHEVDRRVIWIPVARIDHLNIVEDK